MIETFTLFFRLTDIGKSHRKVIFLEIMIAEGIVLKRLLPLILCVLSAVLLLSGCNWGVDEKPVIYFYPTEETEVTVRLDYDGELTCTYPEYGGGWEVTAYPDGKIINRADGREYSYLFWEGVSDAEYDLSEGFVVRGEDTSAFLQEKLAFMGLTPVEYNEFIVYWLPKMQGNEYNLITFQGETYTNSARLDITPEPDSILRVFMAYKPLGEYVEIPEQEIASFAREGFVVVEWGGCEVG